MGFNTGGGGGISAATDVALNSPQDNQSLTYDNSSSKWVNETVSGGGGGSGVAPATKVVAANDAPTAVKASADYVCDGTADEVQINQAIAAIASDTISLGSQGGTVLLWGEQFNTAGAILIRSQVTVKGLGQFSTIIRPVNSYRPGENGGVIELFSADTQYTTVTDLGIHGNGWGASDSDCCGIYYFQGAGTQYDAAHRIINMYIYATSRHGIRLRGGSGSRGRASYVSNIRIIEAGTAQHSDACGLWLDSHVDSFFFAIDVGTSASHGFRINGANNRFVGCKGWFSGSLGSSNHDGSGFYVSGVRNQFVGCESQDNYGDGFFIGSPDNTLSGCVADSNGYNRNGGNGTGGWTGSGYYVNTSRMTLQGNAFDKTESGRPLYQKHAVEIGSGSLTGLIIQVASGASGSTSLGGTAGGGNIVNVV